MHDNAPRPEQPIVEDIWREKYAYRTDRDYAGTCARVIGALFAREAPDVREEALRAMEAREIVPAGRILAGAGTDKRVTLINCFGGKEQLLTQEYGAAEFADLEGQRVTVLTKDGWRPAQIKAFGEQPVNRIELRPAYSQHGRWRASGRSKYAISLKVTPNHRWILAGGEVTTSLAVGDAVESCAFAADKKSESYLRGLRHGLIFGDGTHYGEPRIGSVHGKERHHYHSLRLCGKKVAHLAAFDGLSKEKSRVNYAQVSYPPSAKGDPVIAYYADINCKELPDIGYGFDENYYAGFIDGWFNADGHACKTQGSLMLHSQNKDAIDWLVSEGAVGGYLVSGCRVTAKAGTKTNLGTVSSDVWCVFLRRPEQMKWRVSGIRRAGREKVYCAVVPGVGAFTLANGIYTGNCFVSPDIQDSMRTMPDVPGLGIMDALSVASFTQQMGGGIGMDFSTIRPRGAVVKRTQSVSSGVLPFMDMWDAMCATIRSSGSRRGAMMGTLRVDHPDVEEFIEAKHQKGRLTNFNVSVLVTDAFMRAVEGDCYWDLFFSVPRGDGQHVNQWQVDGKGLEYAYKRVRARELWDKIVQSTYVHAEPGVIFIDRINKQNNLAYCEDIHCVNPCGEQCLPANGICNLGHTNLAVMVDRPFADDAEFDFGKLERAVQIMVRLLDNVIDVTLWPTEEQKAEAVAKRRIGLGFTGLASALQQLGIPYGSEAAVKFVSEVARRQAVAAYRASAQLARERGPFPMYHPDEFCARPFVQKLPEDLQEQIRRYGTRNGVLLSIAPTGTTSLAVGNVSSGIEPVFAHRYRRKVRGHNGEMDREYSVYDYGYLKYCEKMGFHPESSMLYEEGLPTAFVTADQLTVEQHLLMAAAAQEWVDSAISKTINCLESMTLDEFREVYARAYALGMKGCTTYRPDPRSGRGAVLEVARKPVTTFDAAAPLPPPPPPPPAHDKLPMQEVAEAKRYRIKWPHEDCAYYVIITDCVDAAGKRRPFELFVSTKSERHGEWVKAFSLLVTAIFRREGDPSFVVDELRSVFAATGGTWMRVPWSEKSKLVPSLVAAIGVKIEEHMRSLGMIAADEPALGTGEASDAATIPATDLLDVCDACGARAVVYQSGCSECRACGKSDCG